jgi:hypothetical protein
MSTTTDANVRDVIAGLVDQGARFWIRQNRLIYSGPPGLLSDEEAGLIRGHRIEALREVTGHDTIELLACPRCGADVVLVEGTGLCSLHLGAVRSAVTGPPS